VTIVLTSSPLPMPAEEIVPEFGVMMAMSLAGSGQGAA
jgi:hypothetical protein